MIKQFTPLSVALFNIEEINYITKDDESEITKRETHGTSIKIAPDIVTIS